MIRWDGTFTFDNDDDDDDDPGRGGGGGGTGGGLSTVVNSFVTPLIEPFFVPSELVVDVERR